MGKYKPRHYRLTFLDIIELDVIECPKCSQVFYREGRGTPKQESRDCELCGSHGKAWLELTCPKCNDDVKIDIKEW